ncbi:glycerol-3-phosphate dehydrogenase/oxidase [Alkalihalobacillus pseudalcaliphilus]|uniref:glycerol-3-phosphate dehydrogenase/oxidase n=1 Tax=Alkalihalobacillus pseudalcaliphilus TaxID=79884 RepID=UPI00064DA79C|nr:glycerol-3-phosphate dehydrogenase/oxidase [Alkalihalobacillus pseudalcaliphilus]KMK74904.1 glycerol-3-phosphate dehydrogenase [Alkalihalobacillus pseudalcaliphilus]
MNFSSTNRSSILASMSQQQLDVLVIGGGITGAGIALDASSRGMKIGLIEMQDFAAGTSSRSTKLVHGGLRYLKQLEVRLVAEVGKEREIVYENGPHVTTPEWMLLPFHEGGTFGKFSTSFGLQVYDFLAGVKKKERRKMLTVEETIAREPLVNQVGLKGGGYYVEYRTDDARLTIEVLKEAIKYGADALNYVRAEGLIYEGGQVVGAEVRDLLTGDTVELYAKKVVNATGPWVDDVREFDKSKQGKQLKLSKGVHIVVDQSVFPLKQAVYFDTPDGRMVFAIPRENKTYVGTTDTFFEGDTSNPTMSESDRSYLLKAISYMFPHVTVTEKDVESSWAGLRPLIYEEGKKESEISRKDEIWQSDSGLISIAGGKLTGYRKMAELTVNLVVKLLKEEYAVLYSPSQTKNMPISGGHVGGSHNYPAFVKETIRHGRELGFEESQAEKLVHLYGSNTEKVFSYVADFEREANHELDLAVYAQLRYGIEEEMVTKPIDFFINRTGALFFNIDWVKTWKDAVIEYMADHFSWSKETKVAYSQELAERINQAETPSD